MNLKPNSGTLKTKTSNPNGQLSKSTKIFKMKERVGKEGLALYLAK